MTTIVYRGKYPNRIESIWAQAPGQPLVRTNCGKIYRLPVQVSAKLGDDIESYTAEFVGQSSKRRASKRRAP